MSVNYENAHNLYTYNRETGDVISRATGESVCQIRSAHRQGKAGKYIVFDGKSYSVSKIAYLLVNKHIFNGRVSYLDGDPLNTRWDNMKYKAHKPTGPKLRTISLDCDSLVSRIAWILHSHEDPEAKARSIIADKNKPTWLREIAMWLLEP
jgi:hypothetical protein